MVFDTAKQVEYMQYQNLVVIDQNPHQIGYRAAEQLYLQITDNAPIKNISIPETIIEKC
jgi:DNA-binding LacI/PurR family transcriptional regulator